MWMQAEDALWQTAEPLCCGPTCRSGPGGSRTPHSAHTQRVAILERHLHEQAKNEAGWASPGSSWRWLPAVARAPMGPTSLTCARGCFTGEHEKELSCFMASFQSGKSILDGGLGPDDSARHTTHLGLLQGSGAAQGGFQRSAGGAVGTGICTAAGRRRGKSISAARASKRHTQPINRPATQCASLSATSQPSAGA